MEEQYEQELVRVALELVAETRAIRMLLGLALAHLPEAVEDLRRLATHVDDLTLQFPMNEPQRDHVQAVLLQMLSSIEAEAERRASKRD